MDKCINFGCSFPNGEAYDGIKLLGWTDDGAGGQFGYLDAQGNFVPKNGWETDAITHYKASETPNDDVPGVVHITLLVDDEAKAIDPATGQEITLYNDQMTRNPDDNGNLTVWDFTITPCSFWWLPTVTPNPDGSLTPSTRSFTATISPAVDHQGDSMARNIGFYLTSSALRGYCCNAGDQTGSDLIFPEQSGFSVGYDPGLDVWSASTVDPVLTATVTVECYDYGAYGTLDAMIPHPETFNPVGAVRTNDRSKAGTGVPLDDNNNHVADGWLFDSYGSFPASDVDEEPPGLHVGDGYPFFDEYRGFMVRGAYERARPDVKHVFVLNEGIYGMGEAGRWEFTFHRINPSEQSGKVVNYNGNISSQNCILIIEHDPLTDPNGGFAPGEDASTPQPTFGITTFTATPKPATQQIDIYLGACYAWPADPAVVIAHEVGHDLRCCHQSDDDPPGSHIPRTDSVMKQYYPHPLAINDVDRANRDLVDTTTRW